MSKIMAQGGRLDSVSVSGTITESTVAGSFDSSYCDCALRSTTTANIWRLPLTDDSGAETNLADGESGYFHCEFVRQTNGSLSTAGLILTLEDASGFP